MLLVAPYLYLSVINSTNLCHTPQLTVGFTLYARTVTTGHIESRASCGPPRVCSSYPQGLILPDTQNPEHPPVLPGCAPPSPDLQLRRARQGGAGFRGARSPQKANAAPPSSASPWLLQFRLWYHTSWESCRCPADAVRLSMQPGDGAVL